jgi:hypothetical protein
MVRAGCGFRFWTWLDVRSKALVSGGGVPTPGTLGSLFPSPKSRAGPFCAEWLFRADDYSSLCDTIERVACMAVGVIVVLNLKPVSPSDFPDSPNGGVYRR